MDNRLIILCHRNSVEHGGTEVWRLSSPIDTACSSRRCCLRQIRDVWHRRWVRGRMPLSNWSIFQEKPRLRAVMVSVLKLTQVGGERILRRSREPSLRNSAKSLRNFGRRSASSKIEAAVKRPGRLFTKNTSLCQDLKSTYRDWRVLDARTLRGWVSVRKNTKLRTEALVNGGSNYESPKVAKFLVR